MQALSKLILRAVDMQFIQGFEVRGRENAQFILKKRF